MKNYEKGKKHKLPVRIYLKAFPLTAIILKTTIIFNDRLFEYDNIFIFFIFFSII